MIKFDSVRHQYTNIYTDDNYISVTTLLNKFKKPFDVQKHAERVAKKENTTPEQIKEKWNTINLVSKDKGTYLHKVFEKYNKDKIIEQGHEQFISSYKNLQIIKETDDLLIEELLYSHTHHIAGTADIIRKENKGKFSVFDLKTNKKINLASPYGEQLLQPVQHLSSCEYTIYCLQLSLYAMMYQEMTGRYLNQLGIFHYQQETQEVTYYPAIFLKSDVLSILKYYEQSNLG